MGVGLGGVEPQGFYHADCLFLRRTERGQGDRLLVLEQKFPDWLMKITFRERLKPQLNQVLELGLVSQGFRVRDTIWGLWFSFSQTG